MTVGRRLSRSEFGRLAEDAAARYAEAQGFAIVARNWRCRLGEIDIVARDGSAWVVVEVRARRGEGAGTAAESVTPRKMRRLRRLAAAFAQEAGAVDGEWRFDVAAVRGFAQGGMAVEWIRDAFGAG